MKDAKAPNGSDILGTLDSVPGVAVIQSFDRDPETGALTWDYAGETKMDWDGQTPQTDAAGEILFVAEDGGVWPQSQLVIDGDGDTRAGS